jgi:hypothetical protein
VRKPPAAPIPAEHHRTRIRHRDSSGQFKQPPSGDQQQGITADADSGGYPGAINQQDYSGGDLSVDASPDTELPTSPDGSGW